MFGNCAPEHSIAHCTGIISARGLEHILALAPPIAAAEHPASVAKRGTEAVVVPHAVVHPPRHPTTDGVMFHRVGAHKLVTVSRVRVVFHPVLASRRDIAPVRRQAPLL